MSIRFVITDRATGETVTAEAPRSGEHVRKGQRRFIPPSDEALSDLREAIRVRSKLGVQGGCLA